MCFVYCDMDEKHSIRGWTERVTGSSLRGADPVALPCVGGGGESTEVAWRGRECERSLTSVNERADCLPGELEKGCALGCAF
jgi:hypothetical protein